MSTLYPGFDPRSTVTNNKEWLYWCIRTINDSSNEITQAQMHQQIPIYYTNIIEALTKASVHDGLPVGTALSALKVWSDEFDRYQANPDKFVSGFF